MKGGYANKMLHILWSDGVETIDRYRTEAWGEALMRMGIKRGMADAVVVGYHMEG